MTNLVQRIKDRVRNIPDYPIAGVQFKDITPVFLDYKLCADITDYLAAQAAGKVDIVCGVESRGFLLGVQIAQKLQLPFVLIRKTGKLPGETIQMDYELEYGSASIEIHKGFIAAGQRVLIHDDLLATGGTAAATAQLIAKCAGIPSQFSFLIELEFLQGRARLEPFKSELVSVVSY